MSVDIGGLKCLGSLARTVGKNTQITSNGFNVTSVAFVSVLTVWESIKESMVVVTNAHSVLLER